MNIYKTLIIATAIILMAASCGILAANDTVDEATAALVTKATKDYRLTIEVNKINPMGGSSITSLDGYRLSIKDGKVSSHLPFFGRGSADMAYGTDPAGIDFDDCPIEIQNLKSQKKDMTAFKFTAKSGTESIDVTISIWDNGNAEISCNSEKRSYINYSGHLVEE